MYFFFVILRARQNQRKLEKPRFKFTVEKILIESGTPILVQTNNYVFKILMFGKIYKKF